jgi:hypothetical protein
VYLFLQITEGDFSKLTQSLLPVEGYDILRRLTMEKQKDMVDSFQRDSGEFLANLTATLDELDRDLNEAQEMDSICTDEWCVAIERNIDDLHNEIYMISEPRFSDASDSQKIRDLRNRLHDLYERYKGVKENVVTK